MTITALHATGHNQTTHNTPKPINEQIANRALPYFLSRVVVDNETGCHNWIGQVSSKGYGRLRFNERVEYRAHRIAYFLAHGRISTELEIDHLCRNTSCVNPAHMEEVTNIENLRRGAEARRLEREAAEALANMEAREHAHAA